MAPGRNDPCPCGSGKKYKHCCARHDAQVSPLLRVVGKGTKSQIEMIAHDAIRGPVLWEADVTPMPLAVETEPTGRHAAVILAANEAILHLEVEAHPPSDALGVAKLLAKAIDTVLARGGAEPTEVVVRHRAVAAELAAIMGTRAPVIDAPRLSLLDEFARSFRQQVSGTALPPISHPQTWAAWQLPAETLASLFSAAAAYHVAAPWQDFGDETVVELRMPNGAVWHAVVLGFAGQEFGLVLYEKLADYLNLLDAPTPDIGFGMTEGVVISLSFDSRADLPKPMRKEFTDAKWKVAGPRAYPSIWTLNTIGGGLSVEYANDMTMALEVMARIEELTSDDNDEVLEALGTSWTDEVSGTVARYAHEEENYLWDIPESLTPALAEGARADPAAHFEFTEAGDAEDAAIVARFAALHPRDASDVDLFVQLMHGEQGVPLAAVSELDLRVFLYDLLPRKSMTTKKHGNAIRAFLKRFVHYLAAHEELRFPWASAILSDKASFEARWDSRPDGRQLNEALAEWMGELYEDLDARVLLPSNELAGLGTWGELQGIAEASMYSLLQREWLVWRDAEIALGTRAPQALWDSLAARQATWETTPNAALGGRSPSDEIAKERGASKRAKPRPVRRR